MSAGARAVTELPARHHRDFVAAELEAPPLAVDTLHLEAGRILDNDTHNARVGVCGARSL